VALIGNCSLLHKSPAKYLTGTVGFNDRANWNKPGMMRSRGDLSVSLLWKYDAVPSGFYAGRAFFPPQKAGRVTSRTSFTVSAAAAGAQGLPGSAMASMTVGAAAVGGLIAEGVANATMTIGGSANVAGLAAGVANATMAIDGSAQPSAIAWGVANATMTISGSAQPSAFGYMVASTLSDGVLTPAGIAAAVILAAQDTPIYADMRKTNGTTVVGNGTVGDKFRSSLYVG